MAMSFPLVVWNVRGLNNPPRPSSIRMFMHLCDVSLVCFQESKLNVVDAAVVNQALGPDFNGFEALPADGTRGGILLAWKSDRLRISAVQKREFSISANFTSLSDRKVWMVSSVYGP